MFSYEFLFTAFSGSLEEVLPVAATGRAAGIPQTGLDNSTYISSSSRLINEPSNDFLVFTSFRESFITRATVFPAPVSRGTFLLPGGEAVLEILGCFRFICSTVGFGNEADIFDGSAGGDSF